MGEEKDLGIKLFGKKIVLTENEKIPAISGKDSGDLRSGVEKVENFGVMAEADVKKDQVEGQGENKPQDTADLPITDDSKALAESSDSPKTPSINEEKAMIKPPNTDTEQSDTTDSQQKTLKKPDKILPCPRCNSMDTKFCYYNNYNVSQPRHFCKSCQRYWTAGGTMRNMPVGAGRRKNKSSDSSSRHMVVSEALRTAQINAANGIHNTTLKSQETVLSFGAPSSICEPVSSVLTVTEKKVPNSIKNGLYKQGISIPCKGGDYIDDCSSGSSIKNLNTKMEGKKDGIAEPEVQNVQGFSSQVPFHPALPWPFPWNSTVPMQAIYPPGFPFPCYPTPYWNYNVPGSWNMSWLPPPPQVTNQDAPICDSKSQILGKHSREGDLLRPVYLDKEDCKQNNVEQSIVVPKTMRIDDLDEAAKGSIFASLGIKNDTMTKAFQPKKDEKDHAGKPSPVLQANPAAMSRSLRFQERV